MAKLFPGREETSVFVASSANFRPGDRVTVYTTQGPITRVVSSVGNGVTITVHNPGLVDWLRRMWRRLVRLVHR